MNQKTNHLRLKHLQQFEILHEELIVQFPQNIVLFTHGMMKPLFSTISSSFLRKQSSVICRFMRQQAGRFTSNCPCSCLIKNLFMFVCRKHSTANARMCFAASPPCWRHKTVYHAMHYLNDWWWDPGWSDRIPFQADLSVLWPLSGITNRVNCFTLSRAINPTWNSINAAAVQGW